MKPFASRDGVDLYHGDALATLATLPSESVQCIVTSPPFWALRDYGVDGQIGLEATPDEWCQRLVAVFRECRRVLRDDGVMWIECGDTYCSTAPGTRNTSDMIAGSGAEAREQMRPNTPPGMKPKDLCGAPWMLAFALRADGWYLRSDTIWARPNPMPESVTDRPTKAHSYVFLLTKQARYFYDADAIRESPQADSIARYGRTSRYDDSAVAASVPYSATRPRGNESGANARSVWSIATEPTPFAHFATFPQALVERCIKTGTSEYGCCAACGTPWTRVTESELVKSPVHGAGSTVRGRNEGTDVNGWAGASMPRLNKQVTTTGWAASCDCNAATRPCVVLDPFMGSGTTALVARRLGRHAVGIELNTEYLEIARRRLSLPDERGQVLGTKYAGEGQGMLDV